MSDVKISNNPGLSAITKKYGRDVTKSILIFALVDLIEFFNVTNNFTDPQINSTADLIMEKFYWFKPEDFKLCFSRAKTGEYGQTYNRLDGSVIFEWLNKYEVERTEFFATIRPKEHEQPVVRTNDVKEIHKLYDQVVEDELKSQARTAQIEDLKKAAVDEWNAQMSEAAKRDGVDPWANKGDNEWFKNYLAKYPLTESYINFYIKKHLK